MSIRRLAIAALLVVMLLPAAGLASAEGEEDEPSSGCIRVRIADGADGLEPIVGLAGGSLKLGFAAEGGRYVAIVTPDLCVPDVAGLVDDLGTFEGQRSAPVPLLP